jgi:hypothetical protein
MKRFGPIAIVLGFLLLLLVIFIVRGGSGRRTFDDRITLRHDDRIPYGTFASRELLPTLFPHTPVYNDRNAPGLWDSISFTENRQAVVCISYSIYADEDEVAALLAFASRGNYVFLIADNFSDELLNKLRLRSQHRYYEFDSLEVSLTGPRFRDKKYHYPGLNGNDVFQRKAPDSTLVLGTQSGGGINFVQMRVGDGYVFAHSSPLAFSNYFVLQPGNDEYLASVFSVLPRDLRRIAWNEYYISKGSTGDGNGDKEPGWLKQLMKIEAFRWALWLLLFLLLLYAVSEMRRRQSWIPAYERPRNDSLDFVKTVGRLYYDKRDHENLASKMIQYFLEQVRQQYKIPTGVLDADFIKRLQARSGYPPVQLNELIGLIQQIRAAGRITPAELADLHQQLEKYYQYG